MTRLFELNFESAEAGKSILDEEQKDNGKLV
jgi:hypothetical protein